MKSDSPARSLCALAFAAVVFVMCASSLLASRVEVVPRSNGVRVSGARACFSRGSADSGTRGGVISGTYLERMLSGTDVRCLSADKVLNIPEGAWHLTVETDGEVSWHPFVVTVDGAEDENTPIKRIVSDLQPGAVLDLTAALQRLVPRQRIVIYAAPTRTSRSAIVSVRQAAMVVPANVPLTPMILSEGRIIAVGRSERLEVGRRGTAAIETLPSTKATVVVPFVARMKPNDVIEGSLQLVQAKSRELIQSFDLPERGIDGLLIVQGVAPGSYTTVLRSERWTAEAPRTELRPQGGQVLVAGDFEISKRPELNVDWSIATDFRKADFREPECRRPPGKREGGPTKSPAKLIAWRCPADVRVLSPVRTSACEALQTADLPDSDSGKVTWTSPGASGLWIELKANGQSAFERALAGRDGAVAVSIRLELPRIRGRVTLGDDPAHGIVKCGSGTAAVTEPSTGEYECWYRPKGRSVDLFSVSLCDGSDEYVHVVDDPDSASVVDIVIPDNEVAVHVLDGSTGKGLEGAAVWLEPEKSEKDLELMRRDFGRTPKDGRIATKRVPLIAWSACALKEGYERRCAEVKTSRSGTTRVEITLNDKTVIQGRVLSPGPIDLGAVHVVDAEAHELERALVAADGRFHLRSDVVNPNARFVLTSRSHPLLLLQVARFERPFLELSLPGYSERSFVVSSSSERGPLTVAIGDTVIPVNVFLRHQSNHGQQYYLQPDRPVNVAPIGASAEIIAIFGVVPTSEKNPFGSPHLLAMMPKQIVPAGVTRISF